MRILVACPQFLRPSAEFACCTRIVCLLRPTTRKSRMRIMKLREVVHATGLSRSTLLRLERAGSFPRKVKLSARRVGWVDTEVGDWLRARLPEVR